jgi:hypothetical protein
MESFAHPGFRPGVYPLTFNQNACYPLICGNPRPLKYLLVFFRNVVFHILKHSFTS